MHRPSDVQDPSELFIVKEKISKPNGEDLVRTYTRGKLLGKGGFASVYEFFCKETNETYAGKVISKTCLQRAKARQKLLFEIKIHRSMHHCHIVEFLRFFEDESNIYILLEICSNQTLSELLRRRKRLTELEIQSYLAQLVSALKYLHGHRVIHRDIKLGNLFLNGKMEIKLGDFGLATKLEFDGERKSTVCGTPNYIAPEIIDGAFGHSFEVDVWSLGVLVYTLAVGKPPFETCDVRQTYRKIRACAYVIPSGLKLSFELKTLISDLLVVDPFSRLTLDQILYHSFMTRNPIPKTLPTSTLAVPPKSSYLKQFQPSKKSQEQLQILRRSQDLPIHHVSNKSTPFTCSPESPVLMKVSNCQTARKSAVLNDSDSDLSTLPKDPGSSTARKLATVALYKPLENTAKLFVKKWVDYTNKYGLGYVLSNNFIGVYFNDHSKFVCNSKGEFQVVHKVKGEGMETSRIYSLSNYPEDLRKKVTLLEHFRKYLVCEPESGVGTNEFVYVRKWLQTDQAIIFRLSDKTVQIRFLDLTEMVLSSGAKTVAFLNRDGKCEAYPLSQAMQSENSEMVKRIKYTTDLINQMVAKKK